MSGLKLTFQNMIKLLQILSLEEQYQKTLLFLELPLSRGS